MIEPRLLKGFRDYGPKEQATRQDMFSKIQAVFERFGFLPLSTPALEYKDILLGKYGEEEKLIYSFKDNGERDVALRYDLTVPLARYIAQNQNQLVMPFKRYQIAPVWRAENPQKGRFREFYQCDIDTIGTDSPLADAEVIACLCKALEAVGIGRYVVRLNDRSTLSNFSTKTIRLIDKLDKIGVDGFKKELAKQDIPKDEAKQALAFVEQDNMQPPPAIVKLMVTIAELGVAPGNLQFDRTVARGLDYYTGTVFETNLVGKPEYGSICSGGRYDNLVDQFSKTSVAAVGGSIGIDRLFDAMSEQGLLDQPSLIKALVVNQDELLLDDYINLVTTLRDAGINSELYYAPLKLDKQLKYAESKGIAYAVIMGTAEKIQGIVQLKDLKTREQIEVHLADLSKKLQENF